MNRNICGLIKRNADLSAKKEADLKNALNKLHKTGDSFSITEVCKEAGVSRQYLHKHPDLLELVCKYTDTQQKPSKRNNDSIETHITLLKSKLKEKDKEISRLKKEYACNENYKQKYEDALLKIKELEMQLEESYSMNLPTSL